MSSSPAAWCERAASLLSAGVSTAQVERELGFPPGGGADHGAIRVAWQFCVTHGVAAATLMVECAAAAREWDRIAGDRSAALAGPRAAARLVCALPIGVVLLGFTLGLNPLGVLLGSGLGWVCVILGGLFAGVGWWWISRLLAAASRSEPAPGFGCELLASCVSAGLPLAESVGHIQMVWPHHTELSAAVCHLANRTGMPPARALRAEAAAQRLDATTEARLRAARLAVRLTLPLGFCMLPAFVLWGVIPLLLTVLGQVALQGVVPHHP